MWITVKTLQNQSTQIEINPQETVSVLKKKIAAETDVKDGSENLELIYSGKILEDDQLISTCKIEEKSFLVAFAKTVDASADQSEVGTVTDKAPKHQQLLNDDDSPLSFLRTSRQFLQMRRVVHQNPNLLPTLLQQIRQSNPRLLQVITENHDRFVELLNEPLNDDSTDNDVPSNDLLNEEAMNNSSGFLSVSAEEKLAIDRLKGLGFSEIVCTQAYFACEKNEDLAANFLLVQDGDDNNDVS